jgi:BASS family bile acid:Na+ symporter
MSAIGLPGTALGWLGRQGTRAIAVVVFIGIAVPSLDALVKPFVPEAIFALLCIAFLRVETAALRARLGRPGLLVAVTAWTMLVIPALVGGAGLAVGLPTRTPDLFLALMLQAVASPMMAAPAFAAVMGLDATLVLVTLVTSSALTPFTAPLFAYIFIGPTLALPPVALGLKLISILGGSALVAIAIRRVVGIAAITRSKDKLDGLNILLVFVFVGAVMEHVAARTLARPLTMLGLAVLAFAICYALLGLTALVLAGAGPERAFALGLMASQRNMGLMVAATGNALPEVAWLYFALCQFPIYLSPQLLKPLARRVLARPSRQ